MKVLITEEQLKLIINESKEDVYIPIPKEKVDAYKALTAYAKSKGVNIKQLPQFKNYPNQNAKLSDNPWDYNELVSGAIAHNRAINSKSFENLIGKRASNHQRRNKKNDLSIEELETLRLLIQIIAEIQKHGVKIIRVTGGDDFAHRHSSTNHQRARAIDFTIVNDTEKEHRKLESIVGKLIAKHSFLKDNLVFANEYYFESPNKSAPHIHLVLNPKSKDFSKFQFEKDIDGERLGSGNHRKINQKIADKYKGKEIVFDEFESEEVPEEVPEEKVDIVDITTRVLPLGDVKINGDNLIVNMGDMGSQIGFRLYRKLGNSREEIAFKKTDGGVSEGGQTRKSYGKNETISFSIPKLMSDTVIKSLPWKYRLYMEVHRVVPEPLKSPFVDADEKKEMITQNKQTEDFIVDGEDTCPQCKILTGEEIDKYYRENYNKDPKSIEDFIDMEKDKIYRDQDNTRVDPSYLNMIDLNKIEFKKD